jgi:hypothetical protein
MRPFRPYFTGQVVDHHWSFTGTITPEMRAAAKLTIERELRKEPLEELSSQEVNKLAAGVRDRIYTSFLRQQEQEAEQTRDVKEPTRRDQRNEERRHQEWSKKKLTYLDEARRRAIIVLNTDRSRRCSASTFWRVSSHPLMQRLPGPNRCPRPTHALGSCSKLTWPAGTPRTQPRPPESKRNGSKSRRWFWCSPR